jgi:hypothetical protein
MTGVPGAHAAPSPAATVTVAVKEPDCPAVRLRLVGERTGAERAMLTPVPLTGTICGLPMALSITSIVAVREPVVLGVNVTLMLQLAPPATLFPQLFVCAKSVESAPLTIIPFNSSARLPVLVSVITCAALVGCFSAETDSGGPSTNHNPLAPESFQILGKSERPARDSISGIVRGPAKRRED